MNKELINEYFEYKDGSLYWKVDKPNSKYRAGDKAGCKYSNGYYVIKLNNKRYLEHRLIYILFRGNITDDLMVDHIDQNRLNNKIENLRAVDRGINRMNTHKSKNIKIINGKYIGVFIRNKKRITKHFSNELDAKNWISQMKQEVFDGLGK
jgi:hypothetical protein